MPFETADKIWMNGQLVDWDDATIHVLTHSLHYGLGVFEGIRAYETDQGAAVFRLEDHIDRLFSSAKIYMIDMPFTRQELFDATVETVRVNDLPSCYIRPIAYLGYGEMGLNPLPCETDIAIATWPWGSYLGEDGVAHGVRMMISSWKRHDPNALPPAAKGTGMYINSSMAKIEAIKAGYDEAILLSPQGYVSECTGENIFVIRDGRIITPPTSAGALEGITQHSVRTIARGPGRALRDGQPPPQRPVHRRRGIPVGHRRRGGADPVGRRPRAGRARPDHPPDPGDLPGRGPRQGRPVQGLAHLRGPDMSGTESPQTEPAAMPQVGAPPGTPEKVEIFDTTLRDGVQFEGISLTVDDKLRIAEQLDHLGVHYIEGGWPGANPKDDEFFRRAAKELDLDTSTLVAFGSTRRT